MYERRKSKKINIGNVEVGGNAPISVQSMCNTDTRDVKATVRQIQELTDAGCEIIRVAVLDKEAAQAIGQIKKEIKIPIIADIHFDYRLAIESIEQGVDALRLNPGNIGRKEFVEKVKTDDEFAKVYGELGPVYGHEWRHFDGQDCYVDQLQRVIDEIKVNPNSRRLIVNAWQAAYVDKMALPPCHMAFQFYVNDGKLSCQLYQRSADAFLGVPFNIASYSLLTMMVAQVCGLQLGEFVHTFGDCHIYTNHLEQIELQLSREPRELPKMKINPNIKDINDFKYEDFELVDYNPHGVIKGAVAV